MQPGQRRGGFQRGIHDAALPPLLKHLPKLALASAGTCRRIQKPADQHRIQAGQRIRILGASQRRGTLW